MALLLRALAQRTRLELVACCDANELAQVRDLDWFARIETVPLERGPARGRFARTSEHLRLCWLWGARRLPLLAAKTRRLAMLRTLGIALQRRPEVAMLEFAVLAQYLPALRQVPTILTDHERGGHAPAGVLGGNLGRARDERLWRQYMHRFYPQASLLQAVNDADARYLQHTLHREVAVRPVLVGLPPKVAPVAGTRPIALFLGDYAHHPNAEAALHVAHAIWPQIRTRHPQAELWLAGPRAPQAVRELDRGAGVRYLGYVADLDQLLAQTRLLLAPVLSGDGSRVKVLTALAHGIPVVGNARTFAGLSAPALAARRAETADELASLALALLDDAAQAARAGQAGRAWAESELLTDAVVDAQLERIRALRRG